MPIEHGLTHAEYLSRRAVSNSLMTDLKRSPAYCWAMNINPARPKRKSTAAMLAGTLAHCMILEPDEFPHRYSIRPDGMDLRTKAGKEWQERQYGREPASLQQEDDAMAQRAAVLAVPELAEILENGEAEVSAFWTDEATGLLCKARPDWLHHRKDGRCVILDIKTTSENGPDDFGRSVNTFGYHRQAAHYIDGVEACGLDVAEFRFAIVTSAYPFLAYTAVLDEDTLQQGREEVAELRALYAECVTSNHWPHHIGTQIVGLPAWARRSIEIEVGYV